MATVSGGYKVNSSVLINSTVTKTTSGGSTTGTFYTAPANGFAILTLVQCVAASSGTLSGTGTSLIELDGIDLASATGPVGTPATTYFGSQPASVAAGSTAVVNSFYVGPGQAITYSMTNTYGGTANQSVTLRVFGVEYVNV